jgi:hypothetical protein
MLSLTFCGNAGVSPIRTSCAAAAVAAAFDAVEGADGRPARYAVCPRSMALPASSTAPWTIARWIDATGGVWPAPGGVALFRLLRAATALAFQTRTMSVGSAAITEATGISPATAIRTIALNVASQRWALDLGFERGMTISFALSGARFPGPPSWSDAGR